MLLLYYITLFVLKPSMSFSVSHDCVTVTCVTITYDFILHFCLSSKIKKRKIKFIKENKKIK